MPTTLVAVSGMSPAILTETLWVLARECPSVVPEEVVVITTRRGREDLEAHLLHPLAAWGDQTVWQCLRQDIFRHLQLPSDSLALQLSLRVITLPNPQTGQREEAQDLRTDAENAEAADFILQTLAPYADACDHHVIASIAGGRKTMGALLFAAMSLLGKETDRATHVLVDSPYDQIRGFYYPTQPVQGLHLANASRQEGYRAEKAQIALANLPFVPLRNKFEELQEPRRSFSGLVQTYTKSKSYPETPPPILILHPKTGDLQIDHHRLQIRSRVLALTHFLLHRAIHRGETFDDYKSVEEAYRAFTQASNLTNHSRRLDSEDFSKAMHELRTLLKSKKLTSLIPFLAPKRTRIGFRVSLQSRIEDFD